MNDNYPTFPLSQYIVQGIAETVAVGTDIIQGLSAVFLIFVIFFILIFKNPRICCFCYYLYDVYCNNY